MGGWNCDKNKSSRDALVILDNDCRFLGKPWRGNLRKYINEASSTKELIGHLMRCCKVDASYGEPPTVILSIDTPLGFSEDFQKLITGRAAVSSLDTSATNPYLFRYTERFLFEKGLSPLSAVKDMIGSQATKGMHVLAKFAPRRESVGVWASDDGLLAIEAYPSACKTSAIMAGLLEPFITERLPLEQHPTSIWEGTSFTGGIRHDDERDALICALIGWLYINQPEALVHPDSSVPESEGWIFAPEDGLAPSVPI